MSEEVDFLLKSMEAVLRDADGLAIRYIDAEAYPGGDSVSVQPWHRLFVVLSGELSCEIVRGGRKEAICLPAGTVYIIPALSYCLGLPLSSSASLSLVLREKYLRLVYNDFRVGETLWPPDIQYHMEDSLQLSTLHTFISFVALREADVSTSVLRDAFSVLWRLVANDLNASRDKRYDQAHRTYLRAAEYLERHYQADFTRRDIGRALTLTESYLSKLFRRYGNCTVNEYLQRIRMDKATLLLQTSEMSVKEVAGECGFRTVSYFIKTFRRAYSVTPAAYRALHRRTPSRAIMRERGIR